MSRVPDFGKSLLPVLACLLLTVPSGASRGMDRQAVQDILREEAKASGVPVPLALAVAQVESGFRPDAVSPVGARGVMQVMPATAAGVFDVSADRLFDPRTNIRIGLLFLRRLYERYGRRWDLALSHYNGGTLRRRGGRLSVHEYTQGYLDKVLAWTRRYKASEGAGVVMAEGKRDTPRYAVLTRRKKRPNTLNISRTAEANTSSGLYRTVRYRAKSPVDCRLVIDRDGGNPCDRRKMQAVLIVDTGLAGIVRP